MWQELRAGEWRLLAPCYRQVTHAAGWGGRGFSREVGIKTPFLVTLLGKSCSKNVPFSLSGG